MLYPTTIKQALPQGTKTVQIVGISNEPQNIPVSEQIPFCLGPLSYTHPFLLGSLAPIHLLDQDLVEKNNARISFTQNGETF